MLDHLDGIRLYNRNPAPIQITADQLILESVSRMKDRPRLPKIEHQSQAEIDDENFKRRQNWENNVKRNLSTYHTFVRYARWEEDLGELDNARSIYERSLEYTNFKEPNAWFAYIDMEKRHLPEMGVNRCRNLFERAVKILPRHDKFWLMYANFEEQIGDIDRARKIYQRWIAWVPPSYAYLTFANFEARVNNLSRARSVFERLIITHVDGTSFVQYADFELKLHQTNRARSIYERGTKILGKKIDPNLYIKYARLEELAGNEERARMIYRYALENIAETESHELRTNYLRFEKSYGHDILVKDAVFGKRQELYRKRIEENPKDYDSIFELCSMLIELGQIDESEKVFQSTLDNKPDKTSDGKEVWSRFTIIGVYYAFTAEKVKKDITLTREIYSKVLGLVPHKRFTFSFLWIMYAFFEIRQKNLKQARIALGNAIGICPKTSIFLEYIEIEKIIGDQKRIKNLYEKLVEKVPDDLRGWYEYAKYEYNLGHMKEAREIFEKAITENESISDNELFWSYYIDFETRSVIPNVEILSNIYTRAYESTGNLMFWKANVQLIASQGNDDIGRARSLIKETEDSIQEREIIKEIREFRLEFEEEFGTDEDIEEAKTRIPREKEDGTLIFPEEDENALGNLLDAAEDWEKNAD